MSGLLLDTHVWIWLLAGHEMIRPKQLTLIEEAASESIIGIAAISTWEIAMLAAKGRIALEEPVLSWIQTSLNLPGVELIPLTPDIAVESSQLPGNFHGDPADRLIVATARIHQLTLLTHDEKILAYAKQHYVSAIQV